MLIKFRTLTKEKLKNSRVRHLLKTISWRIVGSVDTLIIALFFTHGTEKSGEKATLIMLTDTISKMLLYYAHERVWYRIQFGIKNGKTENKRHIAKAISWRLVGTIATLILATLITQDISTGAGIAGFEVVTKLLLYYLHEKLWLKINVKISDEQK